MSNGKDGLFDDNVGPSLYAAAQGQPVKIWGFFAGAKLCYAVLPAAPRRPGKGKKGKGKKGKGMRKTGKAAVGGGEEKKKAKDGTTNMTAVRYQALARSHFKGWAKKCWGRQKPAAPLLVQDHERCLWTEDSLAALEKAGFEVLEDFPKSSPDLNHIEGAWHLLRQELDKRAPTGRENRAQFLCRLRATVARMNKSGDFADIAHNHKERAADVLALKGAKTKW